MPKSYVELQQEVSRLQKEVDRLSSFDLEESLAEQLKTLLLSHSGILNVALEFKGQMNGDLRKVVETSEELMILAQPLHQSFLTKQEYILCYGTKDLRDAHTRLAIASAREEIGRRTGVDMSNHKVVKVGDAYGFVVNEDGDDMSSEFERVRGVNKNVN